MTHNDVLRSVRYMLDLSDARLAELARLGGATLETGDVAALLAKDDDAAFRPCDDATFGAVLDGLVVFRRGRDENRPLVPLEGPVRNNTVLKRLRLAFELKEDDVRELLAKEGLSMSKSELNALFRKEDHPNFRPCGDQLLRYFLKGLTRRLRA